MILKLLSKPKEIISDSLSGMEIYANSRQIVLENLEYKVRKPSKQGKEYDRRVGRDHTLPDTMTQ